MPKLELRRCFRPSAVPPFVSARILAKYPSWNDFRNPPPSPVLTLTAQVVHFEREVSARGAGVVVYPHALHDHIGCQTRSIT